MDEVVRVKGLRKSYGELVAVEDLDLEVRKGEVFGLLGHNGAGKTTTIECMLGTRRRDAGEVLLLGMDPERERRAVFERVGVQLQEAGYQDRIRVAELCAFFAALYAKPQDWRALLERFGLGAKGKAMASELSGGEKQKLAVVLALLPRPELVFLDELTTGLDPKARRQMWGLVKGLQVEGVTVVLTSHYMEEVEELCGRIAILKQGRVVAAGTPAELVARNRTRNLEEAFLLYLDRELDEEAAS